MYQTLKFKITGVAPLLLHNGRLADPLDPITQAIKKISGKRNKTDADHLEMSRLEWLGSLYRENGNIVLPGYVVEAGLINGAKKIKRGESAKAGMFCEKDFPIQYDGPKDVDELWKDENFRLKAGVRVQRARCMRTRPKFDPWSAEIEVTFDDQILNAGEIEEFVRICGNQLGLCDWRPRYGRFVAEKV